MKYVEDVWKHCCPKPLREKLALKKDMRESLMQPCVTTNGNNAEPRKQKVLLRQLHQLSPQKAQMQIQHQPRERNG